MTNPETTPACGILYVDDEEMALKYFQKALSASYQIFTANTGAGGMEVLRREAGRIGIVVSDQRMPEMLGATFLGMAREEFPHVVRILTTAYSDLESAIQAVNTGHIYQYVVKPWEIEDLVMVLRRAADYYRVLSERNELLALKMTTLQRVICSDRVKWLLLSGRSLDPARQSACLRALAALVKALPEHPRPGEGAGAFSRQQFEITALIRDEFRNASRCLEAFDTFRNAAATPAVESLLEALVSSLVESCGFARGDAALEIDEASNAHLRLPPCEKDKLARELFGLLLERETPGASLRLFETLVALAAAGGSLTIHVGDSVSWVFSPQGEPDADGVIDDLYEKFSASDISRL